MIYIMYRPLSSEAGAYEQSLWMIDMLKKAESITEKVVLPYSETRRVLEEVKTGDVVYFRNIGSELPSCLAITRAAIKVGAIVVDRYLEQQVRNGTKFGPRDKWQMYNDMIGSNVTTPVSELMSVGQFADGNYTGIIKTVVGGRQGNGTYVLLEHDQEKKQRILDDINNKPRGGKDGLIVQEYIPNKGDIRIVAVGGRVVASSKRKSKDTTLLKMNTSSGTSKALKRPKKDIIHFAEFVSGEMGIDVASMDILRDSRNGNLHVVDLNESPTVKILSIRSKVNIPQSIVWYLDQQSRR